MPGDDRAQRPSLLLAGENTGNVTAGLRAKPRPGPSSSFSPSTAVVDNAKRAVASHLRAPDMSRKASAAGRSVRVPSSAAPITTPVDNNTSDLSTRAKAVDTARTSSSSTTTRGGGATLQKRISDLVKRAQPHTIVQTYDKILRTLQPNVQMIVNGDALSPDTAVASSLQSGWKHRGAGGDLGKSASVAAGSFDPARGRFHYAREFCFSQVDPALSLSTITDIAVVANLSTSSTSACRPCLFTPLIPKGSNRQGGRTSKHIGPATANKTKLSIEAWHVIAETPARIELALYELPLCVAPKTSGSSSVMALVWTRDRTRLEVAALFAQLHVPELLANALLLLPSRPSLVTPLCPSGKGGADGEEDDSSSTGLRGFTMALTLRTLDRVIWEHEWYQVDFPRPSKVDRCAGGNASDNRVVTVQLLDEHGAFRDRARYAVGSLGLDIAIDAIILAIDSAIVVDFCAWEESAVAPVWGVSRSVRVVPSSAQTESSSSGTLCGDFTLTAAGTMHELLEVRAADASNAGNQVTVHLVKTRAKSSGESDRVLIKQVDVAMGVTFLNATFGTSY